MAAAMLLKVFGNQPWVNALTCAWISIGNLWMFGELLAAMKKARINEGGNEHAVFRKTGAL